MRYETPAPPAELGKIDGLAYSLWLPEGDPWAGVVIIHGAGSSKESHHDFARAARSGGLSAVCFDQRGHGDSGGELDGRALEDVADRRGAAGRRPAGDARLEHGRLPGDPRRRAAGRARGRRRSARRAPTASWRGLRGGELDFPADVALARGVPGRAPARRRSRAGRAAAAPARRGRRAGPGRPLARAGADRAERRSSSSSPAAITARCSTTPSCRATPCAGCGRSSNDPRHGGRGSPTMRRVLEEEGDHDAALANGGQLHHAVVAPHSRERDEGEEEHQDEQRDDSGRPGPARPGEESALHVRGLETLPLPETRGCFRANGQTSVLSASG